MQFQDSQHQKGHGKVMVVYPLFQKRIQTCTQFCILWVLELRLVWISNSYGHCIPSNHSKNALFTHLRILRNWPFNVYIIDQICNFIYQPNAGESNIAIIISMQRWSKYYCFKFWAGKWNLTSHILYEERCYMISHVQTIFTKNLEIVNQQFLSYDKSNHYSLLLTAYTVQSWHNCHMIWIDACFCHHDYDRPIMAKLLYP